MRVGSTLHIEVSAIVPSQQLKQIDRTTEVSGGDEPQLASDKHNKRERLIPVRSTDFARQRFSKSLVSPEGDTSVILSHQVLAADSSSFEGSTQIACCKHADVQ